jgi:hypothetical protein
MTSLSITLVPSGHRVRERLPKIARALGGVRDEAEIRGHCRSTSLADLVYSRRRSARLVVWILFVVVSIYSASGVRRFNDSNDSRDAIDEFG